MAMAAPLGAVKVPTGIWSFYAELKMASENGAKNALYPRDFDLWNPKIARLNITNRDLG
jgi:hypothetical protein